VPTITLRAAMSLASDRDLIARQYANGFYEVLNEAMPALCESVRAGHSLETAIVAAHLKMLARHPDSLIVRKYGLAQAADVSRRAGGLLESGWPDGPDAGRLCGEFDGWLRQPGNRFNPGTTADLVTAALFAALRERKIDLGISNPYP
jgi:triphosphoribosyl-dephospho-CoA synthase